MRRVHREVLGLALQEKLDRAQADADSRANVTTASHWEGRRKSSYLRELLILLRRMSGPHERCMYCVDSHGTDIEHFFPKAKYRDKMYRWENMLLGCVECGRFKGDLFPLSDQQQPLLINPADEEPWDHLDFDPPTGNLVARYDPTVDAYSSKGEATVEVLQLDRREALAAVYQRTYRRLCRLVDAFLTKSQSNQDLAAELKAQDDHGLLGWIFTDAGSQDPPFATLKANYPDLWADCAGIFRP